MCQINVYECEIYIYIIIKIMYMNIKGVKISFWFILSWGGWRWGEGWHRYPNYKGGRRERNVSWRMKGGCGGWLGMPDVFTDDRRFRWWCQVAAGVGGTTGSVG